jgi:hypothetical protein
LDSFGAFSRSIKLFCSISNDFALIKANSTKDTRAGEQRLKVKDTRQMGVFLHFACFSLIVLFCSSTFKEEMYIGQKYS